MFASVIINNKAAKQIASGHPWVSERDVIGRKTNLPSIVNVIDKKRKFIGMAFCSPESPQFLRIFSRKKETINKNFWRDRIRAAYEKRAPLKKITDAFRVVYAESDGIPSVVIDRYNDVWTVQITSSGAETIRSDISEIIREDYSPKEAFETIIREGNQRFAINTALGQKTGAYLDYRDIRLKAKEFARGRCLDAFCYEGQFSCQIAGNADEIIAVDSSAHALVMAERNAELNGHKNITFVKSNVFDFLAVCPAKFDFIHLDPPSFVKSRLKIGPAIAGYKKLISSALKLLNPRGTALISSCSHNISERMLESCVPPSCKIVWRGMQAKDHPVLRGFPESLYLKAVAFQNAI